jgi:hypothetical protein
MAPQNEVGDATTLTPFDDPRIIVNMSVWEDLASLHDYVYRSAHNQVLRQRKQWFEKFPGPYYVLWWVPRGQYLPGRACCCRGQRHAPALRM